MEFSLGVSQILLGKPHCEVLVGKRHSWRQVGSVGGAGRSHVSPVPSGVQRELLQGCRLCLGPLGPSTGLAAVRNQNASVL